MAKKANVPAVQEDPAQKRNREKKMTAKDALAALTKEGKRVHSEVSEMLHEHYGKELSFYWDLGSKLIEEMKKAKGKDSVYCKKGEKFVETLATALGYKSPATLHNSLTILRAWPERVEFDRFCDKRGECGNRLTFSHLLALARVNDDAMREQFSLEILAEGLTSEETYKYIGQRTRDEPTTGVVGPQIPKTALKAFLNMEKQAQVFNSHFEKAWNSEAFDLRGKIEAMPMDRLNDGFMKSIEQAEQALATLEDHATACRQLVADAKDDAQARINEANGDISDMNAIEAKNHKARADKATKKKAKKGRVGTAKA